MSYIAAFNADPNNPRFIDEENKIEYHFVGFDLSLTTAAKLKIIEEGGRPRSRPLSPPVIENSFFRITLPEPGVEIQVIYNPPPDEEIAE